MTLRRSAEWRRRRPSRHCRAHRACRDRPSHSPRRRPCRPDRRKRARRGCWRHRPWRWRRLPGMRIGPAMTMTALRLAFLTPLVVTTSGAFAARRHSTRRLIQTLVAEPVGEHDLGVRHLLASAGPARRRARRCWARPASPPRPGADIAHEVSEDRERRQHLELLLRHRGRGGEDHKCGCCGKHVSSV